MYMIYTYINYTLSYLDLSTPIKTYQNHYIWRKPSYSPFHGVASHHPEVDAYFKALAVGIAPKGVRGAKPGGVFLRNRADWWRLDYCSCSWWDHEVLKIYPQISMGF